VSPTTARFEASRTIKQSSFFNPPNTIAYTHCGRSRSRWGFDEAKPWDWPGPTLIWMRVGSKFAKRFTASTVNFGSIQ